MGEKNSRKNNPHTRNSHKIGSTNALSCGFSRCTHYRSSSYVPWETWSRTYFSNQIKMSGHIPQICLLFGPSAAGGAYIPAFCDVVVMVDGNASMYLGSPRMAEMVIGEKVSLEEMGGANMHCSVSGCGDVLVENEQEAVDFARKYLT